MSTENLYEYIKGEFKAINRVKQQPVADDADTWFRDENQVKLAGYNIEIWDAVTAGTQLVLGTDYVLALRDEAISGNEGFDVYAGYSIINAIYQGVDLYLTANIVGGYTSRPYRPTFTTVTANTTLNPSSMDDSIIADSTAGGFTITLGTPEYDNQRVAVICSGDNLVEISGPGLDDESYSNLALQYVGIGGIWLQLGGAGGGGGGNLSVGNIVWDPSTGAVPYDKLVADGTIYDIADYPSLFARYGTLYGGDGITTFGVPNMQGIFPGAEGVQGAHGDASWNIGDLIEDSFESHNHTMPTHRHSGGGAFLNTGTTQLAYGYTTYGSSRSTANNNNTANNRLPWTSTVDPGDTNATGGTETRPASIIGRWLIQAFDTVQEVPGDPSLVPTYVLKWGESIGDTPADTVSNIWGEGLFFIGYNYQYGANRVYSNAFMGVAFDGENREILFDTDITGADSIIRGVFDYATTSFQVVDIGNDFSDPLITSIFKFEAAAIGELNPPVDGWGVVYDVPANTLPVPNAWGAGTYEITFSDVIAGAHLNVDITITEDDILSDDSVDGASLNSSSNGLIPNYTGGTTNAFDAVTYGTFVGNITKIRKFSGLLNVIHTDPNGIIQDEEINGQWVTRWGTGLMTITGIEDSAAVNPVSVAISHNFADTNYSAVGSVTVATARTIAFSNFTTSSFDISRYTSDGTGATTSSRWVLTGRWK